MISFFRLFDPFRIIILLLILVAIKLPFILKGQPLLDMELCWMLIGEKMANGGKLYKDIWFQLEPFSGGVYYFLNILFGKSQLVYQITNIILIFLQAIGFNYILNKNNVYNERSSIPALLYIIYASLFFDFNTLSPVLMGTSFILLAFNFLMVQLRIKPTVELILLIGILVSIATLFYLSFIFVLLALVLILLLHLNPPVKLYFTLLTGFLIPYLLIFCYYFLIDGVDTFYSNLYKPFFKLASTRYISLLSLLIISIPIISVSAIAVVVSQLKKYVNYQYQVIQITVLWALVSGIGILLVKNLQPFHLMMIVPQAVVLSSHLFLLVKNYWIKEISLILCCGVILIFSYYSLYSEGVKHLFDFQDMIVINSGKYDEYRNKKILVLGKEKEAYLNNRAATPYLSWQLAMRDFSELNDYHHLSEIYSRFIKDMPEVIVDNENLAQRIFYRIPALKEEYTWVSNDIYVRK